MNIETVKTHEIACIINGTISVPNDPANSDYQAILDWINEGNTPTGPDVIEPDYVALRTGPTGYAPIHEQLAMQTDGTRDAHVALLVIFLLTYKLPQTQNNLHNR